jgi:CDP-diacylglycerol--serine O-phosphatidyltransferase
MTQQLDRRRGHAHRRRRVLVSTAALPAICTLLNGLSGFAAIHFATKNALGGAEPGNLTAAAAMIGLGLFFDALDGRLARLTRKTSDFGAQLDSMCDVVTFGVAPAVLMLRTVASVLRGHFERVEVMLGAMAIERTMWCIAAVYFACAALRLARFNVETDAAESSHMTFRGLPSPGAAAAVASLVLLFTWLASAETGWQASMWVLVLVTVTLPIVTLAMALLMVSRLPYTHLVNHYLRGQKGFGFLVKIVLLVVAAILQWQITFAVLAVGYALSGAARAALVGLRKRNGSRDVTPSVRPQE